jgi:DNA-binding transcriptional LysR family regulator
LIGRISDIDLRLLRIFREVADSGGFAVATAKLNVAESTISQHMSDLEKRVGVRLCERGRAGFRLTDAGEEVYRATVDLLGELDRFRERLHEASVHVSGQLALGLPDEIVTHDSRIPIDGLKRFVEAAPGVHLHIEVLNPRELERGVIENRLHAAISPQHRHVAGLEFRPIFDELNLLYCGAAHPLFHEADSDITDAVIEQEARINRGYFEGFDAGLLPSNQHAVTVYQTEAAALLILTGRYVGFLPEHYARTWVRHGEMRALAPDRISFHSKFCLVCRKEHVEDRRLKLLAKALGV